jgi:hypothetical protein
MSIANRFDSAPDMGFVWSYDSRAARRQFQISVALILILTVAAFALGFLVQFDGASRESNRVPSLQHQTVSIGA